VNRTYEIGNSLKPKAQRLMNSFDDMGLSHLMIFRHSISRLEHFEREEEIRDSSDHDMLVPEHMEPREKSEDDANQSEQGKQLQYA